MKKRIRIVAVILVLVLLGGGCFAYQHSYQKSAASGELVLAGNVDVREVSVAFRQSERITELLVDAGDTVKRDQVLARLDSHELRLQLQKVNAQIQAQQASLDKLNNGTRSEELRQAEEKVRQARAAADYAEGVYRRRQQIYDNIQGVSVQDVDNARSDAEAKSAALGAAEQALQEAVNGPRSEDIRSSEATLESLTAEKARLEYELSQCELRAPADGVIRSRLLEAGDMATTQTPVFKLSLLNKKWVRAYVKETELGRIYEGQAAAVYIDSLPDKPLTGQVGYISSTAEFTPKTVQTDELRTALVYEIRVFVDDADNVLRLGMPATVHIN